MRRVIVALALGLPLVAWNCTKTPDPQYVVTCQLDTGLPKLCESPVRYPGLSLGEHTLTIRAREAYVDDDGDLNLSSEEAVCSVTWTVVAEEPSGPVPPAAISEGCGPGSFGQR